MTRSTATPTNSGSPMTAKVQPPSPSDNSPYPGWLVRVAGRLGYAPSTVKEMIFRKEHNWFYFAAVVADELIADDKTELLDRRCLGLDLIRAGVDPNTSEHSAAVFDDAERDAADDVARTAYLQSPSPRTWKAFARAKKDATRAAVRLERSGNRRHGE